MGGLIDINTLKLVLNRKSQSMVLFITRVKVKFSTFNETEFFFLIEKKVFTVNYQYMTFR